jgi:hypothetical protein
MSKLRALFTQAGRKIVFPRLNYNLNVGITGPK